MKQYLPRLVALPDGRTIALVGPAGRCAQTMHYEDVPLAAAYVEAAETYGWPEIDS